MAYDSLIVDLQSLTTGERALSNARDLIMRTSQDQGALQNSVGDAPQLRNTLGDFAGNWSIHREKFLGEIETLTTNIRTIRTDLEALDVAHADALHASQSGASTSQPGVTNSSSPPAGGGAGAPSQQASTSAQSGATGTPLAPPVAPPAAASVPPQASAGPPGPVPYPTPIPPSPPPLSIDQVPPADPVGSAVREQQLQGLLLSWRTQAEDLASRGLPLTALGTGALALLATFGMLPSASPAAKLGGVGQSTTGPLPKSLAPEVVTAKLKGGVVPAEGSTFRSGGVPADGVPDAGAGESAAPSEVPLAEAAQSSHDPASASTMTTEKIKTAPTTEVIGEPAPTSALMTDTNRAPGGSSGSGVAGSGEGGGATSSAPMPKDLPPPPAPVASTGPSGGAAEDVATAHGSASTSEAGRVIGSAQVASANVAGAGTTATAATAALNARAGITSAPVTQSAMTSMAAMSHLGAGVGPSSSGVSASPPVRAGGSVSSPTTETAKERLTHARSATDELEEAIHSPKKDGQP